MVRAQNSFWVKQVGGDSTIERSRAITVDKYGNTYYTGNFKDTVDFDPGPGVFNLIATSPLYGGNTFISKLDASGNFIWAKAFTSPSPNGDWGYGYAIAVDDSGNVYTTGEFWGDSIDFDPGPGTFYLPFIGEGDCFISKLDKSGNFVWAQKYASSSQTSGETGVNIKPDIAGNVYVVVSNYFSFQSDIKLVKVNAAGNIAWTKSISGGGNESLNGLVLNGNGYLYITGNFQNYISLSPFFLNGVGYIDFYISKLDTSGNVIWAEQIGGNITAAALDIAFDNSLNMFLTGYFRDTVDFDPGPGVYNLLSDTGGYHDAFITKLDSSGNFIWAKSMGGKNDDIGISLVLDSAANIYTAGTFKDTADFDPGPGVYTMTSVSFSDIYFSKLDSAGNFISAKQLQASLNACLNCFAIDKAASIYTTGTFFGTADFDMGAGVFNLTSNGTSDIFIHKFRECTPSSGTDVITVCDSITWIDGITYTSSTNAPVFTIIGGSSVNCDSIVTLDLTITHSTTSTDSLTACDSLTWIDGNTYTSNNNTATYTLSNSEGCDSVITLNLTISTVNVSVSYDTSAAVLTAAATGALSYQWLDCDNGYSVISGATAQSFAPLQNGNYAVAISQNGCTDTSACYPVFNVGMNELNDAGSFKIFPNPSKDMVTLSGYKLQNGKAEITVYNPVGEIIYTTTAFSNNHRLKTNPFAAGVYFIRVKNEVRKLLRVN